MQLASRAKGDWCVQLQKRKRRNPCVYLPASGVFHLLFTFFSPHKAKNAKGRCSFLLPWQLFTAVYSRATLSPSKRGRRAAFLLLPGCKAINSGCWPLDLLSGDVFPNAFLCSSRTQIPSLLWKVSRVWGNSYQTDLLLSFPSVQTC